MVATPSTPVAPFTKLPFWRTLIDAHRGMLGAGAGFWRHAAVWLLVLLALDATVNWFYWPFQDLTTVQMPGTAQIVFAALAPVLSVLAWVVISGIVGVALHRQLLADRIALVGASRPTEGPRTYIVYIARNLAIATLAMLALSVVMIAGGLVGEFAVHASVNFGVRVAMMIGLLPLGIASVGLVGYLPTRMSLALPATAIDSPRQTFGAAWGFSRGSFWRLCWGGLLTYWPLLAVGLLQYAATGFDIQSQLHYVISQSIGTAAGFIAGLIWVAFFSLAYRHLVPTADAHAEPAGRPVVDLSGG